MTRVTVFPESEPASPDETTEAPARIAEILAGVGIVFEQWPTVDLPADADQAAVFAAYADAIARLERRGGYLSKDVLRVAPDHPDKQALRKKFLDEHVHRDAEVRFFVDGAATFYFHASGKVIELAAMRGDLIDVPGGARHWFDMGTDPGFTLLRFFPTADGWEATPTGDPIAGKFVAAPA